SYVKILAFILSRYSRAVKPSHINILYGVAPHRYQANKTKYGSGAKTSRYMQVTSKSWTY
ncbi:hypothetical protein, partial [Bacillus pseudomycoides]|uniref:hypothetical protein n=1 Tax=Bacillus pseudomycoides TaxID=64104 RepID=UPI001C3F2101